MLRYVTLCYVMFNFRKHWPILIMFGGNVTWKVGTKSCLFFHLNVQLKLQLKCQRFSVTLYTMPSRIGNTCWSHSFGIFFEAINARFSWIYHLHQSVGLRQHIRLWDLHSTVNVLINVRCQQI